MMRIDAVILAAALTAAPIGAESADLVVWWEKGFNPEEDAAVREIIAAFEKKTGKQVELVLEEHEQLRADTLAAIEAGLRSPDFIFTVLGIEQRDQWAYEGRLVELTDAIGPMRELFVPYALERFTLFDGTTGQRGLYALPIGLSTFHVHVWKSLLERAGFTLADIPREWKAFWAFWCYRVQPAVREALGRGDVWGVGLPMSVESPDTEDAFWQFVDAYEADYVTPDGRLVIDEAEIRRRLIEVIESYTAMYRKGCTPPDSVTWSAYDNNARFFAQTIVMTVNSTLSIPNALKATRPEDYYANAATIDWPDGAQGQPLRIVSNAHDALVFKDGGHIATAKEFVSFLSSEGWLAHYLDFAGERMMPPMPKLLEAPFWLDPSDPHRIRSAMQLLTRPQSRGGGVSYVPLTGDWRHGKINQENVWEKAIHSVAVGELTPEQAVDEALARIKQILSE
jgi:multiple sugar transport system substrate-binding protein